MRETKFRAWDKKEKRMSKPFEIGDLTGYEGEGGSWVFYQERDGDDTFDFSNNNKSLLSNIELLQYTGLKDKNGKEIYESDILSGDYPDEVFFDKERGQWMVRNSQNPDDTLWEILRDNNCEVIGNIYENKDLLTK